MTMMSEKRSSPTQQHHQLLLLLGLLLALLIVGGVPASATSTTLDTTMFSQSSPATCLATSSLSADSKTDQLPYTGGGGDADQYIFFDMSSSFSATTSSSTGGGSGGSTTGSSSSSFSYDVPFIVTKQQIFTIQDGTASTRVRQAGGLNTYVYSGPNSQGINARFHVSWAIFRHEQRDTSNNNLLLNSNEIWIADSQFLSGAGDPVLFSVNASMNSDWSVAEILPPTKTPDGCDNTGTEKFIDARDGSAPAWKTTAQDAMLIVSPTCHSILQLGGLAPTGGDFKTVIVAGDPLDTPATVDGVGAAVRFDFHPSGYSGDAFTPIVLSGDDVSGFNHYIVEKGALRRLKAGYSGNDALVSTLMIWGGTTGSFSVDPPLNPPAEMAPFFGTYYNLFLLPGSSVWKTPNIASTSYKDSVSACYVGLHDPNRNEVTLLPSFQNLDVPASFGIAGKLSFEGGISSTSILPQPNGEGLIWKNLPEGFTQFNVYPSSSSSADNHYGCNCDGSPRVVTTAPQTSGVVGNSDSTVYYSPSSYFGGGSDSVFQHPSDDPFHDTPPGTGGESSYAFNPPTQEGESDFYTPPKGEFSHDDPFYPGGGEEEDPFGGPQPPPTPPPFGFGPGEEEDHFGEGDHDGEGKGGDGPNTQSPLFNTGGGGNGFGFGQGSCLDLLPETCKEYPANELCSFSEESEICYSNNCSAFDGDDIGCAWNGCFVDYDSPIAPSSSPTTTGEGEPDAIRRRQKGNRRQDGLLFSQFDGEPDGEFSSVGGGGDAGVSKNLPVTDGSAPTTTISSHDGGAAGGYASSATNPTGGAEGSQQQHSEGGGYHISSTFTNYGGSSNHISGGGDGTTSGGAGGVGGGAASSFYNFYPQTPTPTFQSSYVRPRYKCTKPPECRDLTEESICRKIPACSWDQTTKKCAVDVVNCTAQSTSGDCTSVGCSWNVKANPPCFKPIFEPAFCKAVTDEFTCLQQRCLWISGHSTPYCESWEATCGDLSSPSEGSCATFPLCIYDAESNTCEDLSFLDFDAVAASANGGMAVRTITSPSTLFPGDPFSIQVVGAALDPETHMVQLVEVPAGFNSSTTSCVSTTNTKSVATGEIGDYDRDVRSTTVNFQGGQTSAELSGEFVFCVKVITQEQAKAIGPFGSMKIGLFPPSLTSCTHSPAIPFDVVPFTTVIEGTNLDDKNALFTLVQLPSSPTAAPTLASEEQQGSASTGSIGSSQGSVSSGFTGSTGGSSLDSDSSDVAADTPSPTTADSTSTPAPEVLNSTVVCPPVILPDGSLNPNYTKPNRKNLDGSISMRSRKPTGSYALCYANRGHVPVACPNPVVVNATAPWNDDQYLQDIASSDLPLLNGLAHPVFHNTHCKSMTDGNSSYGILTHPVGIKFKISNGRDPYTGDELCAFAVVPKFVEGYSDPSTGVMLVDMSLGSLNTGDSLRVFASLSTDQPLTCDVFSRTQCLENGCSWDANELLCSTGPTAAQDNCPNKLSGYELRREITYENFLSAGEELTISTDVASGGLIFVACLDQPNFQGLGVSLRYRVQQTYCPNDCTDRAGNQNGQCRRRGGGKWECVCNSGFTGRDCTRSEVCRGSGSNAETILGTGAVETFTMQPNRAPCGVILQAQPAEDATDMAKYGIGLSIQNVVVSGVAGGGATSSSSLNSLSCANYYILLKKTDSTGDVIRKLCPADLVTPTTTNGNEVLRLLVEDTPAVYIEFVGISEDTFDIDYTPVSLVCPGEAGDSGIPTAAEECDGRGTCFQIDYPGTVTSSPDSLPAAAFQCNCRVPWASSFEGESCDTCAFGYQADTYPECISALRCPNQCNGHGACENDMNCICDAGWFGLDCTCQDDGERNQEFNVDGDLAYRNPSNCGKPGNIIREGQADQTIMACALIGSKTKCRETNRTRGRDMFTGTSTGSTLTVDFDRRQTAATSSTGSGSSSSSGSASSTSSAQNTSDPAIVLNALASKGKYPDFIRTDNVSGTPLDVNGEFTICVWVQFTSQSNGFLVAKVDSAFRVDGTSPALDRALEDVKSRDTVESDLQAAAAEDSLSTHFAFYVDGENSQLTLLVSDTSRRAAASQKEDWHYVRHFRLAPKAGDLFNGEWRWLSIRVYENNGRKEGQVFVDGFSQRGDPNWVQCLPWLPTDFSISNHNTANQSVDYVGAGSSAIWGYRLKASLDELTVYTTALNTATIPKLAGLTPFTDFTFTTLIILLTAASVCLLLQFALVVYSTIKCVQNSIISKSDEDEEEENTVAVGSGRSAGSSRRKSSASVPIMVQSNPLGRKASSSKVGSDVEEKQAFASVVPVSSTGANAATDPSAEELEVLNAEDSNPLNGSDHKQRDDDGHHVVTTPDSAKEEPLDDDDDQQALQNTKQVVKKGEDEIDPVLYDDEPDDGEHAAGGDGDDTQAFLGHLQVGTVVTPEMVELYNKERARRNNARKLHFIFLQKLNLLKFQETFGRGKTAKDLAKGRNGTATNQGAANLSANDLGTIASNSVGAWQIMSMIGSAMELPEVFSDTFARFSQFFMMDFAVAFGSAPRVYAVVFLSLVSFTAVISGFLLLTQCRRKSPTRQAVANFFRRMIRMRQEALDNNEKFEVDQSCVFTLTLALGTLLNILYMPVTNQALAVLFCHPNISCIYDCYNDSLHVTLVVVSVVALIVMTLGVPLLFFWTVFKETDTYRTYLGVHDHQVQRDNWEDFVDNYETPFSSFYQTLHYRSRYFIPATLAWSAAMSGVLVGMASESVEQMIASLILVITYGTITLYQQSFRRTIVNIVVAVSQIYLLVVLLIRSIQLLEPEARGVGTALLVISVFFVILQLLLLSVSVYGILRNLFVSLTATKVMGVDDENEEDDGTPASEGTTEADNY